MKILERYLFKTVISSALMFMLIILALNGFISLADSFKYVGKGTFESIDAFYYTFLTLPRRLYQIFPFAVLMGAMMGLGSLNAHHELVAIRAAGVSIARIIFSVMKAAFILACFLFILGEYIVPVTEKMASNHWSIHTLGTPSSVSEDAIWVKDANNFIKINSITSGKTLSKISIYTFSEDKKLQIITLAEQAQYDGKNWILNGIEQILITENKVSSKYIEQARWPTLLDLELVDVFISNLEYLSIFGLYNYSSYLDANNLDSGQYWLAFWNKLILPFTIAAMLLLSVPFAFSSSRSNNAGNRIMIGIFIGIVFTISNKISAQFGLVYGLSPLLSASFITTSTFITAFIMIRRMP